MPTTRAEEVLAKIKEIFTYIFDMIKEIFGIKDDEETTTPVA